MFCSTAFAARPAAKKFLWEQAESHGVASIHEVTNAGLDALPGTGEITMKKLMTLSAVAIMAVLSIMPAAEAQNFHHGRNGNNNSGYGYGYGYGNSNRYGNNINSVQNQMQARINAGIANGRISQSEASRLQSKFQRIASLEARLRSTGGGLSFSERDRLNRELSKLNSQITREMNDFEHRRIGFWGNQHWR